MCFSAESRFGSDIYKCFDREDARQFEIFDRDLLRLFEPDELEAIAIPAIISGEVLCQCGYFSSFPDQIFSLASLGEDQLGDVAAAGKVSPEQFRPMAQYLTPAACLHFYP